MQVRFGDLRRESAEIQEDLDAAVQRVLSSGWFILGRELELCEQANVPGKVYPQLTEAELDQVIAVIREFYV